MLEEELEQLRKLQRICIRLNFNNTKNTQEFLELFKAFSVRVPSMYSTKGFGEISHKIAIDFVKDVLIGYNLLSRLDSFDDGKKIISQRLLQLQKELTS